jgi:hypothetical protein
MWQGIFTATVRAHGLEFVLLVDPQIESSK